MIDERDYIRRAAAALDDVPARQAKPPGKDKSAPSKQPAKRSIDPNDAAKTNAKEGQIGHGAQDN